MKQINDNIKPVLALIIVVSAFVYLFAVTLTTNDEQVQSQALIAIVAALSSAISYYFGYSSGAAKKDETLHNISSTSQPTVAQAENVTVNNSPVNKEDEEPKG